TSVVDGLDKQNNSTRTGYYLQKFIDYEGASVLAGNTKKSKHYYSIFRFTELLLNFAEAANEAYGPQGTVPGYSFNASDVIQALRTRAGITSDAYQLEIIAEGKEAFREFILNERRLELCFEGHRFWDIRRWEKVDVMQESVRGMEIKVENGVVTFDPDYVVEKRDYKAHMIYGPIPYDEVLKTGIQQNNNW
ncbi:MAG: RagB/SusD family nutrient uptake outer membrane protein, partial [Proteobacteria bacterium]|nr:RagB/SusD family nutrient uptake outer membrane protein [Pseudomonadota bacterium]